MKLRVLNEEEMKAVNGGWDPASPDWIKAERIPILTVPEHGEDPEAPFDASPGYAADSVS